MSAGVSVGVGFGGMDLQGEVFSGVQEFDEDGELVVAGEGNIAVEVVAVLLDELVEGLACEGAIDYGAADPVFGFFDYAWGEVIEFPAFAYGFIRGEGFVEFRLEFLAAPDFFY